MSAAAGAAQGDAAFCADLVRAQDFDHYAATLFVGPEPRRALLALYAFNVEIVRVRDQVSQPLPGEIRLQWWSDMLAGQGHGGVEGNPVAAELQRAIARYALPAAPLSRLIEAHIFDLYNDPMPDRAALELYLAETSSALLAQAARVLGPASDATDHLAHHAGLATGASRLLAGFPRDAARQQMFLPADLLAQAAADPEDAFAGKLTPALRAALDQFVEEARAHLDQALTLLGEVPRAIRPALLPLALAQRDFKQMARPDGDVLQPRPRSHLATLWTLWRASRSAAFR
ncbi:MAG TPA: phytoene/squalene synthase family protein [Rhodopseudomonas sp.]|uniref:phytoene/squalene synthase family protein n=1 Tax=Rhodopseudomonas sp. TaxID=1078 RepID=UPI002ED7CD16